MTKQIKTAAFQLGQNAYNTKTASCPAHCAEFMQLVKGFSVKDFTKAAKSWNEGFQTEKIAEIRVKLGMN